MSRLHKIFVLVASGRGSVLLWWQCNTLRTSTFLSDVVFSYNKTYVAYNEAYGRGISVSGRQRRGQKRSAEASPLCVASCWLSFLGRKLRRTKRSLAVEANNVLHTRGEVCYPRLPCMMIYVIFATFSFLINQYSFPESGLLQVGRLGWVLKRESLGVIRTGHYLLDVTQSTVSKHWKHWKHLKALTPTWKNHWLHLIFSWSANWGKRWCSLLSNTVTLFGWF